MPAKDQFPRHVHEGFIIFYQHVNNEPAMIVGGYKVKRAWVIPLSMAHMYADSKTGAPTDYLVEAAVRIATLLDLGLTRHRVYTIASAIVDDLPDLLKMPPAPQLTQNEIENAADKQGLVVGVNGHNILDAT